MDVELQAYLDGELSPEEARAVEARLAGSEVLRRKLAVLQAVKDALADAAQDETAPSADTAALRPEPATVESQHADPARRPAVPVVPDSCAAVSGRRSRLMPFWIHVSLAAAAVLLFLAVFLGRNPDPESATDGPRQENAPQESPEKSSQEAAAENAFVRLHVVRERKPTALLDDVQITVRVEARKDNMKIYLAARKPGVSLEDLAEAVVTQDIVEPPEAGCLPCTLGARVITPGGETREARLGWPYTDVIMPASLQASWVTWKIRLSNLYVLEKAPPTAWNVAPKSGGGWIADRVKALAHFETVVTPANKKSPPEHWECFAPVETGTYRLQLSLRTLPARKEYEWPHFEEPLRVEIPFRVSGVVGAWSQEVKGLEFRLATPSNRRAKGEVFPILLQIRNVGSTIRKYNFCGVTAAKIPQPFHFEFFRNDRPEPLMFPGHAPDKKRSVFSFSGSDLFVPHRPGTLRTIVVPSSWWLQDDRPLNEIPGPTRLAARFQFQPTLWSTEDKTIWAGQADIPPISYRIEE